MGAQDVETQAVRGLMSLEARLHEITVPTCVLIETQALASLPYAEVLAEHEATRNQSGLNPDFAF